MVTESPPEISVRGVLTSGQFLHPATLILLAANLVPLAGVLFWNWDAFLLLMLYWLETAIIAFWTIVRVATWPAGALGSIEFQSGRSSAAPLAVAAFFTVHAGIFMAVHFLFLWTLFSGAWSGKVHGVGGFVDEIVIRSGLWVPLIALFAGRGALVLFDTLKPWLTRLLRIAPRAQPEDGKQGEALLLGLYGRIVVMQVTIILGAWFAMLTGSIGALVLLVAVKTAVDLAFHFHAGLLRNALARAKAARR